MSKKEKKFITPIEQLLVFESEDKYKGKIKNTGPEVTPKPENLPPEPEPSEEVITNKIAAKDYPNLYEDMGINVDKLGCIMLDTEKIPVAQYIKDPINDIMYKEGWGSGLAGEESPHVTLLFGLLENGNIWKDKVNMLLSGWELDSLRIEKVEYFDLDDCYAIVGIVEKTPELIEGHERLTLLPHVNTFSEYMPHITLAYIKKEVDPEKWIKPLNKKYKGQKIATKSINYGDLPEEAPEDSDGYSTQNEVELKEALVSHIEPSETHVHHNHAIEPNEKLETAKNALEPSIQQQVILQESNLQQAISRLEGDIVKKVLARLDSGDIEGARELVSEAEEEDFTNELMITLAGYFTVLFPIYAAQLMFARLAEFGVQGVFEMGKEANSLVKKSSKKAAISHIETVLRDLAKAYDTAYNKVLNSELVKLIEQKANERDEQILGKLPANPNREDIENAVNEGKFDKDPAYKLARDLVRQGAGLEEISRGIKDEYSHISQNRAKTIAHHESNRVFNISQYEADRQFLNESGLMNRAYKRLRSRTGDPCPVCNMLIKATNANPVPFKNNFANLGDELTASYEKSSGKMAVQKVLVNYESIKAGNVHVNCRCEYELVIKNEDGTWLNGADFRYVNGLGYNPYRDNVGRFASSPSSRLSSRKKRFNDPVKWVESLTEEQRNSISSWQLHGYQDIRQADRNSDNNKELENLKKALETAPLYEGSLHRGIRAKLDIKVGQKMQFNAISSFSTNRAVASEFAIADPETGAKAPKNIQFTMISIDDHKGSPELPRTAIGGIFETETVMFKDDVFEVTKIEPYEIKRNSGKNKWKGQIVHLKEISNG